jgi:phytol kinase
LILAICDPVAALVGRRFPYGKYNITGTNKSLAGSLAFAVSAFIIAACFISDPSRSATEVHETAFVIAIASALAEAVSHKGFDNLFIPGTVVAISIYML